MCVVPVRFNLKDQTHRLEPGLCLVTVVRKVCIENHA